MILIDYTQIAIGSTMVALNRGEELSEDLVRHLVLNSLRYYRSKFNEEYGELVICCDNKHYWRRDYFPNYKINRKKDREKSGYDWGTIFININLIRDEIKKNFPYKVIDVHGCEADDIIATLIHYRPNSKNIIISSDKDFIQLHNEKVDQFSPLTKRKIKNKHPANYLREHILKGDRSDGVPNVLSADDTFIADKRQKPLRKTTVSTILEAMDKHDPVDLYNLAKCPRDTWIRNYQRNETLIDLSKIPKDITENILKNFDKTKPAERGKLFDYFVRNKLKDLLDIIGDF